MPTWLIRSPAWTANVAGGNAQFFADGTNPTAVNVSAGGTVTGRVPETNDVAIVRTLPAFTIAAAATGNLTSDRDGAAQSIAGRVVASTVNVGAASTLNLTANNNTTLHAATINLTGASANIVNSSSDTNITIGNIPGGTTALNITGSRRTRLLGDITAGGVTVNGTSLDVDPGAAGTSHINSPIQVNTILTAKTGTTDAGTNVITGDPTRSVAGLRASFYQLAAAPAQATIATLATTNTNYTATAPVVPFVAQTTAGGNNSFTFPFINDTVGNPPGQPFAVLGFAGVNTFVGIFRGQVFIPPTTTAAFNLRSDDGSMMYFNGADAAFISNGGDHGATTVAATTGAGLTGWRDVVIAYYENTGTAGLRLAIGADNDASAVTNAQLRTLDPTGSYNGTVNIESGSTLKAGGFATLGNLNFNGATSAANLNLSNTALHTSVVSNTNINGAGAMTLSANNILGTDTLTLADGGTLDINGAGTLRVNTTHTLGSAATINVNSGKLVLNSAGSGTGAVIVHNSGTLGGGGSIAGTATVQSGGHVAPGNSVGTITLGGLSLEGGSLLDVEGQTVAAVTSFDMINVTDPNTLLLASSGATSINLTDLGGVVPGDYVILDYNGSALADADVASKLVIATQIPGLTGSIVNDSANTRIKLHLEVTQQGPPQWKLATGGTWGDSNNWIGGVPNASTAVANFLGNISGASIVTLDGSKQVQEIHFQNNNKYTIAPGSGGTLTVGDGSTGLIEIAQGSHEISAALAFSGAISKTGPGTLTLSGAASHAANSSLAVTAGTVNLNSNQGTAATAGNAASANLAVTIGGAGSSVVANADQSLRSLLLSTGDSGTQGFDLNTPAGAGQFRSIHVYAADLSAAKTSLYAEYEQMYRESIDNPEKFWAKIAGELHWFTKWDKVLDWKPPYAKWFVGAKTNVATTASTADRARPRRQDRDPVGRRAPKRQAGQGRSKSDRITYKQLRDDVCRFANGLKSSA
jgi:fibronectin-binding autotransporter adhesin